MIDFLRDPIWQFIGAVLAAIAVFISVLIFIWQRNKKNLAYDILLDLPTLSGRGDLENRVKIFFDDKLVKRVNLVYLKIHNDGNIPILATDFTEPLEFFFGDTANVLDAVVTESKPTSLNPNIIVKINSIQLEPLLLNGGDSITLSILVSENKKTYAKTRIIGVSELKRESIGDRYINSAIAGTVIATLGGVIFLFIAAIKANPLSVNGITGKAEFLHQLPFLLPAILVIVFGVSIIGVSLTRLFNHFKTYFSIPTVYKNRKDDSKN